MSGAAAIHTVGTVRAAWACARALGVARLDTQLLLADLLGHSRAWLLAHDDAPLDELQQAQLLDGLARRAAGEPLAYVLGRWTFAGLELQVDACVLVPRPETEGLVDWGVEVIASRADESHQTQAADLGTGSGAIALALKARCPEARVVATDCSDKALRVAKSNATRLGLSVEFGLGSWYDGLRALSSDNTDAGRFDVIVSNPPYIAAGDAHLAALRHEPRLALTPGGDGLSDLQHLVRHAPSHLLPGGWLLLEHGHDQADAVASMLAAAGFVERSMRLDLAGLPRHSGGRWLPRT